jgi:hypothetical protein
VLDRDDGVLCDLHAPDMASFRLVVNVSAPRRQLGGFALYRRARSTPMSFGKNPHVAKAEAAEQKAQDAQDDIAREQAWLEAARRWDRAAERETDAKRRKLYGDKAEQARARATQAPEAGAKLDHEAHEPHEPHEAHAAAASPRTKPKPSLLN